MDTRTITRLRLLRLFEQAAQTELDDPCVQILPITGTDFRICIMEQREGEAPQSYRVKVIEEK